MRLIVPQETVLITGASSGIGMEFARRLALEGAPLILVARSGDKLDALAAELRDKEKVPVRVIVKDLNRPEAPREIFDELHRDGVVVDMLINNAGFGGLGRFRKIPLERHLQMLQVNVAALTQLSYLFLPGMIERNRGGLINIGSTAAFQPGPNAGVYYATKAYVLSLSEALVKEVQGTKVKITCLCPGPTRTNFGEESGMGSTPIFRYASMDVGPVVDEGLRGYRRGRAIVVPGFLNRAVIFLLRFTPRALVRHIMTARVQPFTDEP